MSAENEGREYGGHWKGALAGDYLSAAAFDGKTPTLTVKSARLQDLEVRKLNADERDGDTAQRKSKLVLFFGETAKGWVMNRTNATCMAAMFGDEVRGWVGRRVTLCAEMVQVGPKKDLGIRVVGSPDIEHTVEAKIELPRRRPVYRKLVPTRRARPQADSGEHQAADE